MTPPTPPPARSRQPQPPFDLCFMTPPTPPPARSRQPQPPFDLGLINQAELNNLKSSRKRFIESNKNLTEKKGEGI